MSTRGQEEADAPPPSVKRAASSPFAPLSSPTYRMLWLVWFAANLATWMNDVAAAWLMTSLSSSPLHVALVSTAATLPVFLLGIPSGALADSLDRRRFLLFTQAWVALVGLVLCAVISLGAMTPPLLLALVFANGVGLAMRWPVFSAVIPESVPREQLPSAMALNGVSANASRIFGPLIAGTVIASFGSAWVFVLNALLALGSIWLIRRWKRPHLPSPLGREPLGSAIRVGLQFVAQSSRLKAVYVRIALFFFHSTGMLALLPLEAQRLGGSAGTFTLLLAAMGTGAITAALGLPRLRRSLSREALVLGGTAMLSASTAILAFAPHLWLAVPAMFFAGTAWISVVNSLGVSAQLALPDWVRARGMAVYQVAMMGGSALGAAAFGAIASQTSVGTSLAVASLTGISTMLLAGWLVVDRSIEEDLSRSSLIRAPVAPAPAGDGHIVVHIEYIIDPARGAEFRALMQESRRSRLRQGALAWYLLTDVHDPTRYTEQIIDENWTEHLRRFGRVMAVDVALRERKLAFHVGSEPPVIRRLVVEAS